MPREYYVYIMTNRSGTLYIGVTSSLLHRAHEHKNASKASFTGRYRLDRLVYYEPTPDVPAAIGRSG